MSKDWAENCKLCSGDGACYGQGVGIVCKCTKAYIAKLEATLDNYDSMDKIAQDQIMKLEELNAELDREKRFYERRQVGDSDIITKLTEALERRNKEIEELKIQVRSLCI